MSARCRPKAALCCGTCHWFVNRGDLGPDGNCHHDPPALVTRGAAGFLSVWREVSKDDASCHHYESISPPDALEVVNARIEPIPRHSSEHPEHVSRWRCTNCGAETAAGIGSDWRWMGDRPEHFCGVPQAGHFPCEPV